MTDRDARTARTMMRYLDGALEGPELGEFGLMLCSDHGLRREFAELLLQRLHFAELAAERASSARPSMRRLREARPRGVWRQGWAIAAAAAVAVALGIWAGLPGTGPGAAPGRPDPVAHATRVEGKVALDRAGTRQPLAAPSDVLCGDRLALTGGASAVLAFADGSKVELSEGCELTVGGDAAAPRLALARGRLDATVARRVGRGEFVAMTPHVRATVVGTAFTLWSVAGASRLEVAEGVVRADRISDGASALVAASEYLDVDAAVAPLRVHRRVPPSSGEFSFRIPCAGDDPSEARFDMRIDQAIGPTDRVRGVLCSVDFHAGAAIHDDPEWRRLAARMRFAMMRYSLPRRAARRGEPEVSLGASGAASLTEALREFARQTGRPEIESCGLVLTGLAIAGYQSIVFSGLIPERVIAVIANSPYVEQGAGDAYPPDVSRLGAGAFAVPHLIEAAGRRYGFHNTARMLAGARARGALWGMCVQHGVDWYMLGDQSFARLWLEDVVARRLAADPPAFGPCELRALTAEEGWLGTYTVVHEPDPEWPGGVASTRVIAAEVARASAFAGDRASAVWLPSERVARAWVAAMTGR